MNEKKCGSIQVVACKECERELAKTLVRNHSDTSRRVSFATQCNDISLEVGVGIPLSGDQRKEKDGRDQP
jgi:hypothetical protein